MDYVDCGGLCISAVKGQKSKGSRRKCSDIQDMPMFLRMPSNSPLFPTETVLGAWMVCKGEGKMEANKPPVAPGITGCTRKIGINKGQNGNLMESVRIVVLL